MKQHLTTLLVLLITITLLPMQTSAQDSTFHIYICFGQSNMEGMGKVAAEDKIVDERFQVFQPLDWGSYTKETWRNAVPPLCNQFSGLSVVDYFGRTMVENLSEDIKIGVINVAVGGCDIRLFDKDIYEEYDSTYTESWFTDKIAYYNGNPYKHLMDLAKKAQEDGVIKGFLLHQGETNTGNKNWPDYVNKIYTDMLADLSLEAKDAPLLAGQVVHEDQGGICAAMNDIIDKLPETIETSYVIPSSGCEVSSDNVHFNANGYRELGKRYAETMLEILNGKTTTINSTFNNSDELIVYPNPIYKDGFIKYDLDENSNAYVMIHDNRGVECVKIDISDYFGVISLKERGVIAPGLYYATVYSNNRELSKVSFYIPNK